ncbi:MAG: alpha/beta hydrolase [Bacteroidota bacterium]
MNELYLLSGLGADKRVFDFLNLGEFKTHCITWIPPHHDESIEAYAARLTEQIKTPRPILIGVSFGGMIAVEIAKVIKPEKIILISSARTNRDIPFYYRVAGAIGFNKLLYPKLLKKFTWLSFWLFGVTTQMEKALLKSFIEETDDTFLCWAVDQITNWKNKSEFDNMISIHGTRDRLLPLRTADVKIKNGGHLMIVNKADLISLHIKSILK